jgi:hypothetical protein
MWLILQLRVAALIRLDKVETIPAEGLLALAAVGALLAVREHKVLPFQELLALAAQRA